MRSKGQCAAYFVFLLSYLKPVFSLCSIIFCLKSQVSSLKTTLAHCRLLLPTFSWLQKFLTEPSRYTEEKEAVTLRVWGICLCVLVYYLKSPFEGRFRGMLRFLLKTSIPTLPSPEASGGRALLLSYKRNLLNYA